MIAGHGDSIEAKDLGCGSLGTYGVVPILYHVVFQYDSGHRLIRGQHQNYPTGARRAPDHSAAVGVLPWTRDPEPAVLPLLRELGIGFVPYAPPGSGFRTGQIRSTDDLADDDPRKTLARFMGHNFQADLRIADEVGVVAVEVGATPAQVAIAWLLAQGDDIAPIPGTKRARVEPIPGPASITPEVSRAIDAAALAARSWVVRDAAR